MRSTILRGLQARIAQEPEAGRAELMLVLKRAGGALIEPADDGSGELIVTFVAVGPRTAPVVRSPVFRVLDWQSDMHLLGGATDIWWTETSTTIPGLRTHYRFLSRRVERTEATEAAYEFGYPDPFNPARSYPSSAFGMDTGVPQEKWDSVLSFPGADLPFWDEMPAWTGTVETMDVSSSVLRNRRRVTIWRPLDSVDSRTPLPLAVLLDGEDLVHAVNAPRLFDNLVSRGLVSPFTAALVHNPSRTSRGDEYPCNPQFRDFVAEELMPALQRAFTLTHSPAKTAIGGFSHGGLASLWLGFSRPDVFGAVLASSPSLWWGPGAKAAVRKEPSEVTAEPEWLTAQYNAAEGRDLRIWIDVGLLETQVVNGIDILSACRRLRDVLTAKGYDMLGYLEQPCGHEYLGWRNGLALGLMALFGRSEVRSSRLHRPPD